MSLTFSIDNYNLWGGASALQNYNPSGIFASNVYISTDPYYMNKNTGFWKLLTPNSKFQNMYIENSRLQQFFKTIGYYPSGVYYAGDIGLYPDTTEGTNTIKILPDRSTNNNHARITLSSGSLTNLQTNVNGGSVNGVSTFTGNANVSITFPTLTSAKVTICSITRYNGGTRANVLCTTGGTVVHGHNASNPNNIGYVKYNNTVEYNGNSSLALDNFVSVCSRNGTPSGSLSTNDVYVNNIPCGSSAGIDLGSDKTLSINGNTGTKGNFGFCYLIIFPTLIPDDILYGISSAFNEFLFGTPIVAESPIKILGNKISFDYSSTDSKDSNTLASAKDYTDSNISNLKIADYAKSTDVDTTYQKKITVNAPLSLSTNIISIDATKDITLTNIIATTALKTTSIIPNTTSTIGIGTSGGTINLNGTVNGTLTGSCTGNAATATTATSANLLNLGNAFKNDDWYKSQDSVNRLKFDSNADTIINVPTDKKISFSIGNSVKSSIDSDGNFTGNAKGALTASSAVWAGRANTLNAGNNAFDTYLWYAADNINRISFTLAETIISSSEILFNTGTDTKTKIDSNGNFTGNAATATTAEGLTGKPEVTLSKLFIATNVTNNGTAVANPSIYAGNSPSGLTNSSSIIFYMPQALGGSFTYYFSTVATPGNYTMLFNYTASDNRVKFNFKNINIKNFLKIKPLIFDIYQKNEILHNKYGFIAQDVKNEYLELVNINNDYIANIICNAIISSNIIILEKDISSILNINDKIKVYYNNINTSNIIYNLALGNENQDYIENIYNVTNILSSNIIEIDIKEENFKNNENIFVYGTEVDDFHSLDYNSIFTLNVAATQELYKTVDNIKNNISINSSNLLNYNSYIVNYNNELSSIQNDKSILGVINNDIIQTNGIVNILINNTNGNIEYGDYISTSSQNGVGMKQNDNILHNYTIAKALENYEFINESSNYLKCKLLL